MRAASCTAVETIPPLQAAALVKMCLLQPDTPTQTPAFRQTPKVIVLTGVTQVVCPSHAPAPASLQTCPHRGECPRVQPCLISQTVNSVAASGNTRQNDTQVRRQRRRAHSSPAQCATCVSCMSGLAIAGHKLCKPGMAKVRWHATRNACPSEGQVPVCNTCPVSTHHSQTDLMVACAVQGVVLWSATQGPETVVSSRARNTQSPTSWRAATDPTSLHTQCLHSHPNKPAPHSSPSKGQSTTRSCMRVLYRR